VNASWLERLWDSVADRGRELLHLPGGDGHLNDLGGLCRQLLEGAGEASGTALAREVRRGIEALDDDQCSEFLELLAADFRPDRDAILAAADAFRADPDDLDAYLHLSAVVESPCQELLRRINRAPHATAALVALRAHLLGLLRDRPHLRGLDADFQHIFLSWFNRGFLELRRIDWDCPASVLEKLIEYEAVHAIQNWSDLRRRLADDRRCFAFFHPALPDDPLIFVEVALVRGLPDAAAPLLDLDAPVLDLKQADTALFFSINNCQDGLRGISFGNFLIKQVVAELAVELPGISRYATLSPMPRFAATLRSAADGKGPLQLDRLTTLLEEMGEPPGEDDDTQDLLGALLRMLDEASEPDRKRLDPMLARLALAYLTRARRHDRSVDPVAAFHLSNGARLERILPFADTSPTRMRDSFGVMVNYLYDPDTVEKNHELYVSTGKVVMSKSLAREVKKVESAWGES